MYLTYIYIALLRSQHIFSIFAVLKFNNKTMFRIKEIIKNTEIDGKRATLSALAQKIGTNQPHLSNIINGNATASLDMLKRVADALNVHIYDLFEKEDNDNEIICPKCGNHIKIKVE